MKEQDVKTILLTSLLITTAIFLTGVLINYGFDYLRIEETLRSIENHEINVDSYFVQKEFTDTFASNKCELLQKKIYELKRDTARVGTELSTYGVNSWFKKNDFDYLKRRYFLLELNFYIVLLEYNQECEYQNVPILFFYRIGDTVSEREGYILEDVSKGYHDQVTVLSFDIDYEDELLIGLLKTKFNVTNAPTVIIGDQIKKEGTTYTGELNATIEQLLLKVDSFTTNIDFNYVITASGADNPGFIGDLNKNLNQDVDDFAKGDTLLILGRLTKNDSIICDSLQYYDTALQNSKDEEEKAVLYETIASIGCGRNKKAFLLEAANLWQKIGADFRAQIDYELAYGNDPIINSEVNEITLTKSELQKPSQAIIGASEIIVTDKDRLLSQADRVNRDWLSQQLSVSPYFVNAKLLTTFSERRTYNATEFMPETGWHEGARIQQLKKAGAKHTIASGAMVKKIDGKWYAPNEKGTFMFEVPLDKVSYPTTRFLKDDIAVIVDTHGVNVLVEQAIRTNATIVVGCCDHPGKIKAAEYLAGRGIEVVCFTDKYLPLALFTNLTILGSPPITEKGDIIILGNRPIVLREGETIIVQNATSDKAILSYYQTPTMYFTRFVDGSAMNLTPEYVTIDDLNQMGRAIDRAKETSAKIIAVRIFNSDDYYNARDWLKEDRNRKAILFHSEPYPYGHRLFNEFPEQTSFDDINPVLS